MKKAQTEIIGLLVIVILFIFGGLIYIMFAGSEDNNPSIDVIQSEKVQNLLDAFIQVTPCFTKLPYDKMDTIIKDCYLEGGSKTICGMDCRTIITDTIENVVKGYNSKQVYHFNILSPSGQVFVTRGNSCSSTYKREAKATERVLAGTNTLKLELTYCIQ